MKRRIRLLSAIAAALMLAACFACTPSPKPAQPTEAPRVTEIPEAEYTVSHIVRYWPEEADYDTCDYACVAQVPEFSKSHYAGYAMNAAVDEYLEELSARIEKVYMPSSVAEPPYTEVTFEYKYVRGVTNVIFRETHSYEAQPYTETHVIMMNGRGERVNLCDVFMNYHAEERIAAAIAARIAGDPKYYEADAGKILSVIDINERACASESGAVLFIPEGVLAPYEEGELEIPVTFEEVLPELLGEGGIMTLEELTGAVRLMRCAANAIVVRMQEIKAGEAEPYTATAFMGQAVTELGLIPSAGRIEVPKADFEALYSKCIAGEFPGIDADAHDIRLEEGAYSVSAAQPKFVYNIDIIEASPEGDTLTIKGDLIYGAFGYAYTEFVCHTSVTLIKNAESPFGWTLRDLGLSL
jgi:hypothetical protein